MNASCPTVVPDAVFYFANLDTAEFALIIAAAAFTLVTNVVFLWKIYVIQFHIKDVTFKRAVFRIAAVFPIGANFSLIAACIPRAAGICDIVFHIYAARVLFVFVDMIIYIFGNRQLMARKLVNTKVRVVTPPLCCFYWLPRIKASARNLFILSLVVAQAGLVRVITNFITGTLQINNGYQDDATKYSIMVVNIISTMTGVSTSGVFANLAVICMLVFNLQGGIFNLCSPVVPCTALLSPQTRAALWNHLLLTLEMMLLSVATAAMLQKANYGQVHELICNRYADTAAMFARKPAPPQKVQIVPVITHVIKKNIT